MTSKISTQEVQKKGSKKPKNNLYPSRTRAEEFQCGVDDLFVHPNHETIFDQEEGYCFVKQPVNL